MRDQVNLVREYIFSPVIFSENEIIPHIRVPDETYQNPQVLLENEWKTRFLYEFEIHVFFGFREESYLQNSEPNIISRE